MVKGDRVEVLVDVGGAVAQRFEIVARRAGRRVDVSNVRGTVEVTEMTRSGRPIRTARFHGFTRHRDRRAPGFGSGYRLIGVRQSTRASRLACIRTSDCQRVREVNRRRARLEDTQPWLGWDSMCALDWIASRATYLPRPVRRGGTAAESSRPALDAGPGAITW